MIQRSQSRPARGAWIETPVLNRFFAWELRSRPARGAWIETVVGLVGHQPRGVAPREGRVD